jgi:hypothetical protein
LRYAKQKKYEFVEDYYNRFLQLCVIIPQPLRDIYLREAFKEGLKTKVKKAIISMLCKTLAELVELAIMIEEEMLVRRKNIARYRQESNNEELKDYNEEEKQQLKEKETKDHSKTYRKGVHCESYYNKRHSTNECKLLNKFC